MFGVSLDVARNLGAPILIVGAGSTSPVLGTAVPPAAVDEAADTRTGEHQIGTHWPECAYPNRQIHSISQAAGMEERPHGTLRSRVPAPVGAHVRAAMRRAWRARDVNRHGWSLVGARHRRGHDCEVAGAGRDDSPIPAPGFVENRSEGRLVPRDGWRSRLARI